VIERAAVLVLDEVIILDFRPDTIFYACRYIGFAFLYYGGN
jgi:hypothetical protein